MSDVGDKDKVINFEDRKDTEVPSAEDKTEAEKKKEIKKKQEAERRRHNDSVLIRLGLGKYKAK